MKSDREAPGGRGLCIDRDLFVREICSLRTYLLVVAGRLKGAGPLPELGISDLVDGVICDACAKVRGGDAGLAFRSIGELKAWLVQQVDWALKDCRRRHSAYERLLRRLGPPRGSGTLSGEERIRLLLEALGRLDPADGQLIDWRFYEELTYEEIGRRRGTTAAPARRMCLGALEKLGSIYRGLGGSPPP